jgi:cob(I)alamin adenosyltransferase
MKIYTKRGDKGETDLFGGERVSKTNIRVWAYGDVDAANSVIGFAAASAQLPAHLKEPLLAIMSDLFDMGAELSAAEREDAQQQLQTRLDTRISLDRVAELERLIDAAQEKLPELKTFILPTGSDLAARFHLARTQVRRAEQTVLSVRQSNFKVRDEVLVYLNRLSDLMFVWARLANMHLHQEDVQWKALKSR